MANVGDPDLTALSVSGELRAKALAARLTVHREKFIEFVQRRTHDHATAEDLVNETFVRALVHVGELRDDEAVVAWFYRALRNAVVDHHRRLGAAERTRERWATETDRTVEPPSYDAPRVCGCVTRVAASLKPEYREALQRLEIDGDSVRRFAEERGISGSNAAVRVFRAREALRRALVSTCGECAEGGCVDCTCDASSSDAGDVRSPGCHGTG